MNVEVNNAIITLDYVHANKMLLARTVIDVKEIIGISNHAEDVDHVNVESLQMTRVVMI